MNLVKHPVRTGAAALATAMLGVSMLSTPVQAADAKLHPASVCVRTSGSNQPTYNASAIGNASSTQALYIDCPVLKDSSKVVDSWVRVLDHSFSSSVRCSVNSTYMNTQGSVVGWFGASHHSTNVGTRQLATGGRPGSDLGHYFFRCRIPPRENGQTSWVSTFYVKEP